MQYTVSSADERPASVYPEGGADPLIGTVIAALPVGYATMPGMGESPPVPVLQAAAAFGLDAASLRRLSGHSGSAWEAGSHVLRVGNRARVDIELAAAAAASAVLPVPEVSDRADLGDMTAVLLDRLPGQPAAVAALGNAALAGTVGRACGTVHAELATVPAPQPLRAAPLTAAADGQALLLHLDLHPLNILVSGGEVTGVLDWANAAAGDPMLDRARSWTILNLDPAARARQAHPGWQALTRGWAQTAGLDTIPGWARAWACRFMLTDLARRYWPADLGHVRDALRHAEAAT
jgi:Ser/Thr protein kinase RdoA (MazF antagonist)